MAWSCLPFIRSDQNHLARHSERGKKTRQTEEEVGRQRQGMDRPGVRQGPEGSEETGCEIICAAPTTLVVKGLMMMMVMKSAKGSSSTGSNNSALIDCIPVHSFRRTAYTRVV